MAHYGKFENVKNYIAIVGNKNDQEKAGYYGEKIVLKCPELGKADQGIEWFDRGMEAVSLFFSGEQVDTMQFWRNVVKCDCLSCQEIRKVDEMRTILLLEDDENLNLSLIHI